MNAHSFPFNPTLPQQQLGYDNTLTGIHEGFYCLSFVTRRAFAPIQPKSITFHQHRSLLTATEIATGIHSSAVRSTQHHQQQQQQSPQCLSVYGYYSLCGDRRITAHQIITIRRRQPCRILIKASAKTAC